MILTILTRLDFGISPAWVYFSEKVSHLSKSDQISPRFTVKVKAILYNFRVLQHLFDMDLKYLRNLRSSWMTLPRIEHFPFGECAVPQDTLSFHLKRSVH